MEVLLGAVAANRMDGDPLWLMFVGPPGSGKTEVLQSITGLPNVHPVGTLTEAALLSGTPGRERARDAKGGLLRVIGSTGLILCKDFTTVLSMHRETRACLLAALREIYDGSWTRHVGADGGRILHWAGRVALIAGVTPVVDSHHAVISAMGERFLLHRMPRCDRRQQAGRAMWHTGQERNMRRELSEAVKELFASLVLPPVKMPEGGLKDRIIGLACLAAQGRSAVERDSHTREVELIPESEAPGRLAIGLARLYGGMRAIGIAHAEAWRLTAKVGLDCLPAVRRAVLETLLAAIGPMDTPEVAAAVRYPTTTARRALEDLAGHGLIEREPGGGRKPDSWGVTPETRELVENAGLTLPERGGLCVPEMSLYTTPTLDDDISGTQTPIEDWDCLGVS
ncbi:MAG: hypothetical protein FJW34_03540 [Acidobacteria bacterium]|nr:hypothetical protein [Acidobacteriota bacterium]